LMDALKKKHYDEARELIVKRKGINKVNEYNQNPLLLALEAGQFDLALLLIEAGADVNIKSKMNKTPLQVAAQAGDLETVKLLFSKGASPDPLEDELPPVFYALMKKHYESARVLIESKCDLKRSYIHGIH
jgi:ankyrin repeat protein